MALTRSFYLLWISQFISLVGTDITKFALRVWTYQATGSVASFALVTFFAEVPALLLSTISGAIVDRYPRKYVLIYADALSSLATFTLAYLYYADSLEPWQIYVANMVSSIANGLQWPAFVATTTLMIPQEDLLKYSGFSQALPALSMLLSPTFASILVAQFGVGSAFVCELSTFLISVIVTSLTVIPTIAPPQDGSNAESIRRGVLRHVEVLWGEGMVAWRFIRERPGLTCLLGILFVGMFTTGLVQILTTPLILSMSTASVLGYVLTLSGFGALIGIGVLSVIGKNNSHKVEIVLVCFGLQGSLLFLCGLFPDIKVIFGIAFTYMSIVPISRAYRETIWQTKTPADLQGRVFALQRGLSQMALPMACVLAGPLADNVCEPLLAEGGLLSTTLGRVIGNGTARGASLLFVFAGLFNVMVAILFYSYPPLKNLDALLPDIKVTVSTETETPAPQATAAHHTPDKKQD